MTKTTVERVEAKVRYIGLFDSVSALGIPTDPQSVYHTLYAGYGQDLDLSKVGAIRHAMAANEARTGFDLVSIKACSTCKLPGNANEDFFVGAHADIGRGYGISEGGSAAALYPLAYIYKGAREAGVLLRKDSRLESAWDEWQHNFGSTLEQTNDLRYILERLMDREERTVYYNSGSETLSFNEMRDRAFRSSTQGWRTVEEDEKKVDAATAFKEKP